MSVIKKILLVFFCGVILCLCAFFSLAMLLPGASEAAEGSGKLPALIGENGINDAFGDEFEDWFSKNFAFRGKVVDLFADFKKDVFATGNDQVVVGKDGFLFFADTVPCFTGTDPMTDEEISSAAASLDAIRNRCGKDCDFLFVCAPDKNTVYPELMPPRYLQSGENGDLDRLLSALDELGVPYLDLRPTLIQAKQNALIYHKKDTHWNGVGAKAAFEAVCEKLGIAVPEFAGPTFTDDFEGDLDSLLYPGSVRTDSDAAYNFDGKFVYTTAVSTPMDLQITARGGGEKDLVIFRDSFANALIPFFASAAKSVRFERANPYRVEFITDDTDAVIVEIAERNLRDLCGCGERITAAAE